jgi:hypothetical protein
MRVTKVKVKDNGKDFMVQMHRNSLNGSLIFDSTNRNDQTEKVHSTSLEILKNNPILKGTATESTHCVYILLCVTLKRTIQLSLNLQNLKPNKHLQWIKLM